MNRKKYTANLHKSVRKPKKIRNKSGNSIQRYSLAEKYKQQNEYKPLQYSTVLPAKKASFEAICGEKVPSTLLLLKKMGNS